jgi:hypothetical protein
MKKKSLSSFPLLLEDGSALNDAAPTEILRSKHGGGTDQEKNRATIIAAQVCSRQCG